MDRYRKAIISAIGTLLGFVAVLAPTINPELLPPSWRPWLALLVGVLTTYGVYKVENEPGRHEAA